MKRQTLPILANVSLSIFLFIVLQMFYTGVITSPRELDSIKYHIPIAKSYLNGKVFSSPDSPILHRFFPGASEGILAVFILFHIPLNLYNVLGVIVLAWVSYLLGKRAGLTGNVAIIFATGFASLTAVVRWLNVQIVDIWVAVFYGYLLYLVLKPGSRISYFLKLGIAAGMVIGSKYSGPFYVCILFVFFSKQLIKKASFQKIVFFLIPFFALGGFWYIKNYLVMGNPVYPIAVFGFPGVKNWALEMPVWKAALSNPSSMISALISEYLGWFILLIIAPIFVIYSAVKKKYTKSLLFALLGLANLIAYLPLPNGESYTVHVSNLRYSYPVFLPLILGAFVWAKEYKREEWISLFAVAGVIFSIQVGYHPKLILIYVPLLLLLWKLRSLEST